MILKTNQRIALLFLRLSVGWLFLYAGITKIIDPNWSAFGYISNANNLKGFFSFLASPEILPITNLLNEWGLAIIGFALILGIAVKITSFFGGLMMLLYYLVILDFPYPNTHSFIVDEHIIYIFAFIVLFTFSDNLALFSRKIK